MRVILCTLPLICLLACRQGPAQEPLLDEIVAAQQAVERVQGEYRQTTTSADEPEGEPNVYQVTFYLELPDRYHLCYAEPDDPETDEDESEAKEWWLGDGKTETHAEQIDPALEPIVSQKPVDKGD